MSSISPEAAREVLDLCGATLDQHTRTGVTSDGFTVIVRVWSPDRWRGYSIGGKVGRGAWRGMSGGDRYSGRGWHKRMADDIAEDLEKLRGKP